MISGRMVEIGFVVAVDADRVRLAAARDLVLADYGYIVLGLAGDHAGVAAGAGGEADRPAPGVAGVLHFRIERARFRRPLFHFLDEVRTALGLGAGSGAHCIAT